MSYVHSGSVLFQKQRVLCAEHAQTKSAPKPLQNTLHGKGALGGKLRESGARAGWKSLAVVPRINLERYGRRAFSCAGPTLWNALPLNLRTQQDPARFRRDLKTYLFNVAYSKYFFFTYIFSNLHATTIMLCTIVTLFIVYAVFRLCLVM